MGDGEKVVVGHIGGAMTLWDTRTSRRLNAFEEHAGHVHEVTRCPNDSNTLVSASDDGTAKLWRLQGQRLEEEGLTLRHEHVVRSAVFSHDGQRLMTTSGDGKAHIWSRSGKLIMSLEGHAGVPRYSRFNADSTRAVTSGIDRTARVWITRPDELVELASELLAGRTFRREELEAYRDLLGDRIEELVSGSKWP